MILGGMWSRKTTAISGVSGLKLCIVLNIGNVP